MHALSRHSTCFASTVDGGIRVIIQRISVLAKTSAADVANLDTKKRIVGPENTRKRERLGKDFEERSLTREAIYSERLKINEPIRGPWY